MLIHHLQEILNYTCQELIRVVPFFASASEAFITSIITRVSFDVFLPGDYVTQYGTIGTKMYFIQHGVLDVVNKDGNVVSTLCDGSYFGGKMEVQQLFTYGTLCNTITLDNNGTDCVHNSGVFKIACNNCCWPRCAY
jgi:signal-transduction protein with cAMP-binding, CBS, and nucleotidyltransferase domain